MIKAAWEGAESADRLVLVVDAAANPPVVENAARIVLRQNGVPVVRPAEAR